MASQSLADTSHPTRQALLVWVVFIVLAIILNGTILFVLGADLQPWTFSIAKDILFGLIIYGGVFLVIPLILVKGWQTVRQPGFLLPLLLAIVATSLWSVFRGIAAIAVLVLAYLHWRFDLSGLGLRSKGWRGDATAILLYGLLGVLPSLLQPGSLTFAPGSALLAGLDRLFANPGSSVENIFYFGFLAERLSHKFGILLTTVIIGLMYTAHEMTNPEYWYEGMNFAITLVGVALVTALYLWRRNVVAIWLGDGLRRVLMVLF